MGMLRRLDVTATGAGSMMEPATDKATQGPLSGSTSPLATEVVLTVDTGIAGEFVLQRPAR